MLISGENPLIYPASFNLSAVLCERYEIPLSNAKAAAERTAKKQSAIPTACGVVICFLNIKQNTTLNIPTHIKLIIKSFFGVLFVKPPFHAPFLIAEKIYITPPADKDIVSPITRERFPVISICTTITTAHTRNMIQNEIFPVLAALCFSNSL